MRKALYAIISITLLITAGCTKSNLSTTSNNNGSWTFKSVTYAEAQCTYTTTGIYAATSTSGAGSAMNFAFLTGVPTNAGSYSIVDSISNNTQIYLNIAVNGVAAALYNPLGTGSVSVSIVPTGQVILLGTNIPMVNKYAPYDTAALTFNVLQTQ